MRSIFVAAALLLYVCAPCASRADPASQTSCDGVTLELTCPTSGAGVRQTLTTLDASRRLWVSRGYVQEAWRSVNSLRITLPFTSFSHTGDVELEYVRAARSHLHTSRAGGIDLVLPTGGTSFGSGRFSFDPFYATYTKLRHRMLLLSFAQIDVDSGPVANRQVPVTAQCTLVQLLPRGYYAGTRMSSTSTTRFDPVSTVERFQIGSTSDRAHVALFVDVPLNRRARAQSLMTYGITYNILRSGPSTHAPIPALQGGT